jgi:hypothetical protein
VTSVVAWNKTLSVNGPSRKPSALTIHVSLVLVRDVDETSTINEDVVGLNYSRPFSESALSVGSLPDRVCRFEEEQIWADVLVQHERVAPRRC